MMAEPSLAAVASGPYGEDEEPESPPHEPGAVPDIEIADPGWLTLIPEAEAVISRAFHIVWSAECPGETPKMTAIRLTDDAEIRELNRLWRQKDQPTNVLAFPGDPDAPGEGWLGDIVLALETCAAEAAREAKAPSSHLAHLIVHASLHLLGYDHEDEVEASEMEAREIALLHQLGLPNPYDDNEAGPMPAEHERRSIS